MIDKGKGESIIIGDPHTSNISQGGLLERLRTRRITSPEAVGDRLNWAAEHGNLTRASRTVRHIRANSPMLREMVQLIQSDRPPMPRGINLHTKKKRGHRGKANITHMVGWSKPALLRINCSLNMLARRLFCDRSTEKPWSSAKTNRPGRRRNKHRLFILWCHDTFHPSNLRRYIVLFKCGMVRRWTHGAYIVHLPIQAGAPPFYTFLSFGQMVMAKKDAIRNGLYTLELYWMITLLNWKAGDWHQT
jgi:hypothetical protein